jgi:hypothetical protein
MCGAEAADAGLVVDLTNDGHFTVSVPRVSIVTSLRCGVLQQARLHGVSDSLMSELGILGETYLLDV